jgi:hypothetical protein
MRRQRDPWSSRFGPDLRQARERLGLSLETVQDRTGVRRFDLEALEAGDLSRFSDEKTALIAVRRCAETLGLDASAMTQAVGAQWLNVTKAPAPELVGATRATANRAAGLATPQKQPGTGAVPAVAGHLSRYPGDASHLRAFTQTAQVPQVAARAAAPSLPPGLRFDSTDALPVTWRGRRDPDPAPLALRVAVWTAVLLLVLGVAGMAVHHWRPAWLTDIHLVSTGSGGAGATHGSHGGGSHPTVPAALVTTTTTGPTTATVSVRASVFEVVVTTQAPCWIHVTGPASLSPLFSATVPAGTTKTFTSTKGQLSVELGASHATVTTQILTKTVPGWTLSPSAAPYIITFRSAPA